VIYLHLSFHKVLCDIYDIVIDACHPHEHSFAGCTTSPAMVAWDIPPARMYRS